LPPLGFPVFDGKFPPVEWNGFPGCETEVFAMIGLLNKLNLHPKDVLKAPINKGVIYLCQKPLSL
jgi:hypothetical protein